jgi:hypothetical protein
MVDRLTDVFACSICRAPLSAGQRACPVEAWPGYSRPLIRVADFLKAREDWATAATRSDPPGG